MGEWSDALGWRFMMTPCVEFRNNLVKNVSKLPSSYHIGY